MRKHLQWILPLIPVVIVIGGVPFFAEPGRIWILPELAFWFALWTLITPFFLLAADILRRQDAAAAAAAAAGSTGPTTPEAER